MDDFKNLTVEIVEEKHKLSQMFRDHGHESHIKRSYEMVRPNREPNPGCSVDYVWETGELFLKTKEALEKNEKVVLQPFDNACLKK